MKKNAFNRNSQLTIGRSTRSWRVVATSILLCVASACGVESQNDEDDVSSQSQAVTGECHIQRSYGWRQCSERVPNQTLVLLPGESKTFYAAGGIYGVGTVTVVCHSNGDGEWDEKDIICWRGNRD